MKLRRVAGGVGFIKFVKDLVAQAEETGYYLVGNGKPLDNVKEWRSPLVAQRVKDLALTL